MSTNNAANIATGAVGEVLTGTGVGVAPTFQAAAGGGVQGVPQAGILNLATAGYAGAVIDDGVSGIGSGTNYLYLFPLTVSESFTIAKLHVHCTGAVAGATSRIGVYNFVDTGVFTLVADYGTVDCSSTGRKSVVANLAITPANRYYTAFTCDNNGGVCQFYGYTPFMLYGELGTSISVAHSFRVFPVSGAAALTSTVTIMKNSGNPIPTIFFSKV